MVNVEPRFFLGCDYNPEQWPKEVWNEDIALMQRAGVGLVSVGIFAWARTCPEEGVWDFEWLDEVMDNLDRGGIKVSLATGTASIPPWLARKHPEIAPVDERGMAYDLGSRQTWAPTSEIYRRHSLEFLDKLARRYADHPALALWHVSNELGCHNRHDYSDSASAAFRVWLRNRYGDLDTLNHAWGTAFWSQHYSSFDQITAPRVSTAQRNPGQLLDFSRFSSDALLDQHRAERDLLRTITPGVPSSTNFMCNSVTTDMDYFRWADEQDVVSQDHYLHHFLADPEVELSWSAALTRGTAKGKPWILMEHSTSAVNWQRINKAKPVGGLLRNSLQHMAAGADGICFFQWRQSAAGAERFHSALVPHGGPETRVYREVCQLGEAIANLSELEGSTVEADVAILFDYEAAMATATHSLPSEAVNYVDAGRDAHRALRARGINADVVSPWADLSGYKVVIVPTLQIVADDLAERLRTVAESGAQVLITYFSGISDLTSRVILGGYPGAFRDLLGIRSEEFYPLADGETVRLDGDLGELTARVWTELLQTTDAEVLARYADDPELGGPQAGGPAITRAVRGSGAAWYLSTRPDDLGWRTVLDRVCADAGVNPTVEFEVDESGADPATDPGHDLIRRSKDGQHWLFALNHGARPLTVTASGFDLVGQREVENPQVPAGGAMVIREA